MTFKSGKVLYGCWHCPKVGANFYEGIGTADCCDTDRCNKPKPFNCHLRETENEESDKCEADGVESFCAGYYDDYSVGKCTNECKNQKLNVRIEGGKDAEGRDRPMMCCDTEMCNMPKTKPTQPPEDGDDESGGASSMNPSH
ncbi:unnamed protein product, partial [Mesorhabditis belari]|uniref:Uncharacterized protein n=1 Tax=Mesorhabditis belari TaxID=2138241 RepID=A0AAF3JAL4_9BILA